MGVLAADVYGPSLPLLTGVSERPTAENKRIYPIEAYGLRLMSMGFFLTEESPVIWRGPMVHGLIKQFLTDVEWGELDYLIIDMPPGTGDIQLTLSQKAKVSGAVIVTTPQDIALLDARKGIEMFRKVDVPVLGIIENMAVHVCSACGHREHIFGDHGGERIAQDYGVPLLASLPLALSIREQTDAGQPTVIAEPESDVTRIYLSAAARVQEALAAQGESAVRQFPEINITDD